MLSVESRDGEKGLGFVEMEETELEEGEACYYRDEDDDDANYDPDVALSYIDEKLQDVLGHFQKDFEGGVSAENLGSKFGGYGSFLPSYQRSPPILSHPRTPQKVHNHIAPKSPKVLEGALQNTTILPYASLSARLVPTSSAQPISAVPSMDNSGKRDMFISTARAAGELTPKHDPVSKSVNATDQKTLKVRLKVGPDNISARNNAAIYSGLGLDISPSSSPEDSADESGELQHAPDESPMTIIKIMTSSLLSGEPLLSPLPDSLLYLTEKEKPNCKDGKFGTAHKGSQESSSVLPDDYLSVRDNKGHGEKKMKFVEKNGRSLEVKNSNFKDEGKDRSTTTLLTKEIDIETPAGRELVSKALKLPLLSDLEGTSKNVESQITFDSVKGLGRAFDISRESNKALAKDRVVSSDFVDEALESVAIQGSNRVRNVENESVPLKGKISSADKVWEEKKVTNQKDISFDPMKDGRGKGDKNFNTFKVDSDGTKGRKDHTSSSVEPPRQKVSQNSTLYDQDREKMLQGKERTPGGKNKQKASQSNGTTATELPKEHSKGISSVASKDKKKSKHARDFHSEHKSDAIKSHKFSTKITSVESHKDFLGDMKGEQADSTIDFQETHCKDRVKDSKPEVEKDPYAFIEKSKERSGVDKVEKPLGSEAIAKASAVNSVTLNGLASNAVTAPLAPVVIEENWVCCDRCQKWRLLPFGTNPDHLPKKWLCSMLDWLPGMNRCNFSEEETTKALNALYQVPAPESQNNLHGQHDGVAPGITLADMPPQQHPSHDLNLHAVPSGGKKKHGSRDTLNAPNHAALAHHSSSMEKNQQGSVKSRSLNDVNHYPLESNAVNTAGFQHTSKSNDFAVEKHRHKQKEKHKLLGRYSVGGDFIEQSGKHSKTKIKREADPDGFRISKKSKTEGLHYTDEDWHSDRGAAVPKLGDAFLTKVTGENLQKDNDYTPFKDTKCDRKDNIPASGKKRKDQKQGSLDGEYKEHLGAIEMGKHEMDFTEKKRKVKERHENQVYPETLFTTAHISDNGISVKEEISESELKKDKKARVSKSEKKESSSGKADGRADKRGSRVTKILLSGSRDPQGDKTTEESRGGTKKEHQLDQYTVNAVLQRTLDGIDASKGDHGYGQPSMAATSSSSKVSGSHKSKANFQESRGSPVESVSSSPNRSSNAGNLTTARRNHLLGKEDSTNVGLSVLGSPRRCSDGEGDGRSDRSDILRKERASSIVHHGSLESHRVAESPVLDSLRRAYNYQDRNVDQISGVKDKDRLLLKKSDGTHYDPSSTEFEKANLINGGADTSDQHYQYPSEQRDEERDHGKLNNNYRANGSSQRKSGKGSSSRSRDRHRSAKSDFDQSKVKVSDSFSEQEGLYPTKGAESHRYDDTDNESRDRSPYHEELRNGKYNFQENKDGKNYVGKKDYSVAKCSSEGRKGTHSKFGVHGKPEPLSAKQLKDINSRGGKSDSLCVKDRKSNGQHNLPQVVPQEDERSPNYYPSDRTDRTEMTSGRGKSQLFSFSGDKQEIQSRFPRAIPTVHKGSRSDALPIDVSNGDALKVPKHPRMPDIPGGAHHNSLRHPTPNRPMGRDLDAPSPVRKDGGQAAASAAMKEAKDLKHSADRLKNSGSELESTGLYFQAALKFLHGASLLEPCSIESAKHGEMTQSMQVYTDTARLCEFCAHEYERHKEMAAAALAYKCMEVAYMRVIYSKHSSANKDRHELQTGLQVIPPGESPSSSASDIDNLNNSVERGALAKGAISPQIAGNHVIMARNRPNFARLLNFAQDVTSAIEALRKSQNAFSAANVSSEEARYGIDSISSVRRVLDFNYHDVEGLLRLVRLAMEAISR